MRFMSAYFANEATDGAPVSFPVVTDAIAIPGIDAVAGMTTLNHPIDPLVDYAFKRLFANPEHLGVLVAFLNAVLQPAVPIVEVSLVPTESGPVADADRTVVVDVWPKTRTAPCFTSRCSAPVTPAWRSGSCTPGPGS